MNPSLENFRIGSRYTESGIYEGDMDELTIYDRVLSGEEITALYNSQN